MSLLFAMNLITACYALDCGDMATYYLKDVKTYAIDAEYNSVNQQTERNIVDTLRHQLTFETNTYVEFVSNLPQKPSFGGMNVAYGCQNVLLNPITTTKSSFSVNKNIYITDISQPGLCVDSIPAFTNLLENERIKAAITFPEQLVLERSGTTNIDYKNHQLMFLEDDYEFYFKWETSDGIELEDIVKVYLAL